MNSLCNIMFHYYNHYVSLLHGNNEFHYATLCLIITTIMSHYYMVIMNSLCNIMSHYYNYYVSLWGFLTACQMELSVAFAMGDFLMGRFAM